MIKSDFIGSIEIKGEKYQIFNLNHLEKEGLIKISSLPYSIRVLVENLLRRLDDRTVSEQDVVNLTRWKENRGTPVEIPFYPARILMQDFTGVPAVVDLAAMRDAVRSLKGDPRRVNPLVPVDLVIDHSIQVDYHGTANALVRNLEREYQRSFERYRLLKWAQRNFDGFRVVPPKSGICHQINIELLGKVVQTTRIGDALVAYPDTVIGLDSHTTMINGMGVLGWGVGGIEAEAVMLGQPYYLSTPEVVGVRLKGRLRPGTTATDLVLTLTEKLRNHGVVEKFVEYFGPGLKHLTVPDRATVANMAPEYGATVGFFPVDECTIEYLRQTDRALEASLAEAYCRANNLFYSDAEPEPEYTEVIEFDLGSVERSIAGPARPNERMNLTGIKRRFGHPPSRAFDVNISGNPARLRDGSVVIAAISSCTNTSNPSLLFGAALLAKRAVERGLRVPPYVKTSFSPGSRTVARYLENAGLMPYLKALGFHVVGFGCATCIGNSGPLHPEIVRVIKDQDLDVAAVLSGNRNFEARIHQQVRSNFLASPPLVIAYALAGCVDIDLVNEPVGIDPNGEEVYLDEIWPRDEEIRELMAEYINSRLFAEEYKGIFEGDERWQSLSSEESLTYPWDPESTYIKRPPYFERLTLEPEGLQDIINARVLVLLGDNVTTDHISPAGAIPESYPAGQYLMSLGVSPGEFNSYGSRRGNHEVMMRGTFANLRLRNLLVAKEGAFTIKFPEGREMFIFDAAQAYRREGTPVIILGGKNYGVGSSRDWAAKGPYLLGVRAVIAESFERIHRSNLIGMGILPLQFVEGEGYRELGLNGTEVYNIRGLAELEPHKKLRVEAIQPDGSVREFDVVARIDTKIELEYLEHGGILPYVLRKIAKGELSRS